MKILKTFCRVYTSDIEETLSFYGNITGRKVERRFHLPGIPIEIAYIGDFLILAGTEENLGRFRQVQSTCIVEGLEDLHTYFLKNGANVLRDPQKVPTGRNMTIRHPDGLVIEYVEPTPNA